RRHAGDAEHGREIRERLRRLGAEIAGPDELARRIERDLPGHVHRRPHLHGVREAGKGREGARVDVARVDRVRPGPEGAGRGGDAGGEHYGGESQQDDPHAMLLEVGGRDVNATLYTPRASRSSTFKT